MTYVALRLLGTDKDLPEMVEIRGLIHKMGEPFSAHAFPLDLPGRLIIIPPNRRRSGQGPFLGQGLVVDLGSLRMGGCEPCTT